MDYTKIIYETNPWRFHPQFSDVQDSMHAKLKAPGTEGATKEIYRLLYLLVFFVQKHG